MTSQPRVSLDQFPQGRRGRIVRVGNVVGDPVNGEASLEELLLGLGFEEGAGVEVLHQGPFGGPLAVQVNHRLIALRPADAAAVLVDPDIQPSSSERTP